MAFQTQAHACSRRNAFVSNVGPRVTRVASRPVRDRRSCIVAVHDIISEADFEQEVLKADGPVLVDFWAPWCGPCKLVAPLMKWAEETHRGALKVVKVEHGANKALIEKYKVYGLPTLIVFKGGKEVPGSKNEGAIGKAALEQYIKQHALTAVNV